MEENSLDKNIIVKLPVILLAILVLLSVGFGIAFYRNQTDGFYAAVFSGVATGLFVSVIQFIISWYEHTKIKGLYAKIIEFEKMGISRILPHRDDDNAYRNRVRNANKQVLVMGHTASRFINDFADLETTRDDRKVLLTNLVNRTFKTKILIPDKEFLKPEKARTFDDTLIKMKKIRELHNNFEVKFFQHTPTHSIFISDNECLIGPIFPNIESQDTPTLQSTINSDFSNEYINYFDDEWDKALSIDDK